MCKKLKENNIQVMGNLSKNMENMKKEEPSGNLKDKKYIF